jgi:Protein of unknown function (DUF1194)
MSWRRGPISKLTRRSLIGWIAAGSAAGISQAEAQTPKTGRDVDLNLVLAVDASGSVNQLRFELQKQGYATAFANLKVLGAIRSGPHGSIAVSMFQWTGQTLQRTVIPWTRLSDEASVGRFASAIAAAPRDLFAGGTSISGAIDYSVAALGVCPFKAGRQVIDISGDGANNRGRPPSAARDVAVALGININGLPILEIEHDLEDHYRNEVIGGPGSFVIPAESFRDFSTAILRKLIREINVS